MALGSEVVNLGVRLPSKLHWNAAQAVAHELEGYQGGVSAGSWQGGELLQTEVQRRASCTSKHEGQKDHYRRAAVGKNVWRGQLQRCAHGSAR